MGGSRKLSCSTSSKSTAACCASPSRSTSSGATTGTITKIISNASSTQAQTATPANSAAATSKGGQDAACVHCASQLPVPNRPNTRLKLVAPTSSAKSAP